MPDTGRMERHVRAWMRAEVQERTDVALLVGVSDAPAARESLSVRIGGAEHPVTEARDRFGNRLHLLHGLPGGEVEIAYDAHGIAPASAPRVLETDSVLHLRPSRYCEVDELAHVAEEIVGERQGGEALDAVVAWVAGHLQYVPGSSTITDSALSTFAARRGVCRDYAHLTATLLRAAGIPARCSSVYAPGLSPMDFHLVVEALVEGRWLVADATHLAPRASMVRIATGQDAADTAFMTTLAGDVALTSIQVTAVVDPELPLEDAAERLELR
ncbi:MAG TPA: transglutaminase family protein [Candidatus Brachybacterium intestinipullorum]|uniref:Transglutaminase family protein n=2 Tax=Brachybacterium TaxID=43668 RepID=A0A9D2PZ35_9MICO|nr:transglutaminase family protein [Candidatus Brachybacterium intestinipullorum]